MMVEMWANERFFLYTRQKSCHSTKYTLPFNIWVHDKVMFTKRTSRYVAEDFFAYIRYEIPFKTALYRSLYVQSDSFERIGNRKETLTSQTTFRAFYRGLFTRTTSLFYCSNENVAKAFANTGRRTGPAPSRREADGHAANGRVETGARKAAEQGRSVPSMPESVQTGRFQQNVRGVHAARLRGLRELQQAGWGRGPGGLEMQRLQAEVAVQGRAATRLLRELAGRADTRAAAAALGGSPGHGRRLKSQSRRRISAPQESGAAQALRRVSGFIKRTREGNLISPICINLVLALIPLAPVFLHRVSITLQHP